MRAGIGAPAVRSRHSIHRRRPPWQSPKQPAAIDEDKLDAFVFRAVDEVGATLNAALVVIGDRLGLYRALAGAGALTPAELAERTGTSERYVREWLNAQAAGGYVDVRPGQRRATRCRPSRRSRWPTTTARRSCRGFFQIALGARARRAAASSRPSAAATASAGTSTTTTCFEGCERFFRPGYNAQPGRRRGCRRSTASSAKLERRRDASPTSAAATAPRRS